MGSKSKISTGPNARPKDETLAQTGGGLPDDTGPLPDDIAREADEVTPSGKAVSKKPPPDKQQEGPPPHRLQEDPPEGSREEVDDALEQQSGRRSAKGR